MVSAWFPGSTIWEVAMAEIRPIVGSATPASFVLGRKLDSVPFGAYWTGMLTLEFARHLTGSMFCG
jgi:hypothetical protein